MAEILWYAFAAVIVGGLFFLMIRDSLQGTVTWAGRVAAVLFIPGGIAMAEGSVPIVIAVLIAIAVLGWIDWRARPSSP